MTTDFKIQNNCVILTQVGNLDWFTVTEVLLNNLHLDTVSGGDHSKDYSHLVLSHMDYRRLLTDNEHELEKYFKFNLRALITRVNENKPMLTDRHFCVNTSYNVSDIYQRVGICGFYKPNGFAMVTHFKCVGTHTKMKTFVLYDDMYKNHSLPLQNLHTAYEQGCLHLNNHNVYLKASSEFKQAFFGSLGETNFDWCYLINDDFFKRGMQVPERLFSILSQRGVYMENPFKEKEIVVNTFVFIPVYLRQKLYHLLDKVIEIRGKHDTYRTWSAARKMLNSKKTSCMLL